MEALNNLHAASSFEEFDKTTDLNCLVESNANYTGILDYADDVPYLESLSFNGGGLQSESDEIENKLWHATNCSQIANKFTGYESFKTYYKFFSCHQWFCPKCGEKGGPLHKKRLAGISQGIRQPLERTVLKQLVFTVPEDAERELMHKKALGALRCMTNKIVKKFFPGLKCVSAVQLFGDRSPGRYRPHVHVLIYDAKECLHLLPPEVLDRIRKKWRLALQAYLRRPIEQVVINYSFQTKLKRMEHLISYVARPNPGYKNFVEIKNNHELLNFVMNTLKGFRYISYFNGCRSKKLKDLSKKDDYVATVRKAGERLVFCPNEQMTRTEFNLRFKKWDYDDLGDGLYRINSS